MLYEVITYPRLSHRYYALKAKWLGLDKLTHTDRNAPLPGDDNKRYAWADDSGRQHQGVRSWILQEFSPYRVADLTVV